MCVNDSTGEAPKQPDLLEVLEALRAHPRVAWAHKVSSGVVLVNHRLTRFGWSGCPDVLGQLRDGRFLGVCLKAPGGALRPEQSRFLHLIAASGGVAFDTTDSNGIAARLADLRTTIRRAA